MDYRYEAPPVLRDYLIYHETIKGHSRATVDEYFLDLRNFFRFLKIERGLVPHAAELTTKAKLLDENPLQDLDSPRSKRSLPRYLTLEESERLLNSVDGMHKERDFCILTIFLNCGLRISEIAGMNLSDIRSDHIRVLGKGNKERVVYLNDATAQAINDYLIVRRDIAAIDRNALFLSSRRTRITREALHAMVKKSLLRAGLDADKYSAHKLRHTAATLMLSNGVDVRTLQELLGHENLNTTQIYTHVDNSELRIAAQANPLGKFSPEKSDK